MTAFTILSAVTGTGASTADFSGHFENVKHATRAFQAWGATSSGVGAASINVEVSLDNSHWVVLGTINLTLGTSATSDGFASVAPWKYVRGNVTSISGTGANVTLICGV